MLKRIAFVLTVVIAALMPITPIRHAHGFNDKMRIIHFGQQICVDWWAWPGHMIQHGDTLVEGNISCDVPVPK